MNQEALEVVGQLPLLRHIVAATQFPPRLEVKLRRALGHLAVGGELDLARYLD